MTRTIDVHLDWLSATTAVDPLLIVHHMRHVMGVGDVRAASPHTLGYTKAYEVLAGNRDKVCTIESGAPHGRNLVVSTGSEPNAAVRSCLANTCDDARATRVDSAIDLGGDFDCFADLAEKAARAPRRGTPVRSVQRIESATGRTLYLGSPASPVRVRVYEKGREQTAKGHPAPTDWIRIELQWRPSDDDRRIAMSLRPSQMWGVSQWTADIASQVMDGVKVLDRPVAEATTWDKRYHWLCTQSSGTFREAVSRYGLLAVLADMGIDDVSQVQGAAIAAAPTVAPAQARI